MRRASFCEKTGLRRGIWSQQEDRLLTDYINKRGPGNWRLLPIHAGLKRCGKSCRLRWLNYLQPKVKRGNFTRQEDELIVKLHEELGNKWSKIAASLPGRTDNEIKNHWHTNLKKGSTYKTKSKEAKRKPINCEPLKKLDSRPYIFPPDHITPLILESSEMSPNTSQKSEGFSSSAFGDEVVMMRNYEAKAESEISSELTWEFDDNSWDEPSLLEYMLGVTCSTPKSQGSSSSTIDYEINGIKNHLTDENAESSELILGFDVNFLVEDMLDDIGSTQKSQEISSTLGSELGIMKNRVTDGSAVSSELNLEFDVDFSVEDMLDDIELTQNSQGISSSTLDNELGLVKNQVSAVSSEVLNLEVDNILQNESWLMEYMSMENITSVPVDRLVPVEVYPQGEALYPYGLCF